MHSVGLVARIIVIPFRLHTTHTCCYYIYTRQFQFCASHVHVVLAVLVVVLWTSFGRAFQFGLWFRFLRGLFACRWRGVSDKATPKNEKGRGTYTAASPFSWPPPFSPRRAFQTPGPPHPAVGVRRESTPLSAPSPALAHPLPKKKAHAPTQTR